MTLVNYLDSFMEARDLTRTKLIEQTNLNPQCLTQIFRENKYTMFTVLRLIEIYGDEFKQFLEYRQCVVCGKLFIPMTRASVTCKEPECIKTNAYNGNRNRPAKATYGEANVRCVDYGWKPKKPKVSIGEFNHLADKDNMTYGERQQLMRCKEMKFREGLNGARDEGSN